MRRAAQAFITMRERIERHVSQRTEMLAGVSHDLKTPLTRMKLALAMMHDERGHPCLQAPTSPRWSTCSTIISPSRAAKAARNAEDTDLGELVRDTAAAAAKARARRRGARVTARAEHADAQRQAAALRRCLTNLVDNALKHGRQVAVTLSRDERYAEIAVEDDGPGIPESAARGSVPAVPPPGRRPQPADRRFGLGLAIARDIARAHGGDIVLDKSPLGGLKATIRLPV